MLVIFICNDRATLAGHADDKRDDRDSTYLWPQLNATV